MNDIINKHTKVIDLGLIDYKEGWNYQENLFAETVRMKIANRNKSDLEQLPTPNFLIFCQHDHVYTIGKSGKVENLLVDESGLEEINAKYYKINRGGDITYHGPGQIVCYPIIDLENFFTDIHKYLRFLEQAVMLTCHEYGIDAGRVEGLTGVWVDFENAENITDSNPRKICAFGVKTSRWVTMHGLALNVNSQLSYFDNIIPCGIDDKDVTSMSRELKMEISESEVKVKLQANLASVFEMEIIN